MGKQEIITIIRANKPEIEARYGVMRSGLYKGQEIADFNFSEELLK